MSVVLLRHFVKNHNDTNIWCNMIWFSTDLTNNLSLKIVWIRISGRSLVWKFWVLSYDLNIRGVNILISRIKGQSFLLCIMKILIELKTVYGFLTLAISCGSQPWELDEGVVHFLDHVHILYHDFLLLQQKDYCQYLYYLHKHRFWVRDYCEHLRIRRKVG